MMAGPGNRVYGQRTITMLLRSATDSCPNRASAETMKPTSSPERGRHESIGDCLVWGPMVAAEIPLHVCPGFSHS